MLMQMLVQMSKYEQIWADMSKYELHKTSWGNGEKGDWGLEIGSGVLFVLQMFFYLTILKVLFIFKSAQLLQCNVPCDQNYFHLIKILKYIVIIDWNTYIVIIQLCVYELRMLSPSFCIQRSQCNCSYCCFQLREM